MDLSVPFGVLCDELWTVSCPVSLVIDKRRNILACGSNFLCGVSIIYVYHVGLLFSYDNDKNKIFHIIQGNVKNQRYLFEETNNITKAVLYLIKARNF